MAQSYRNFERQVSSLPVSKLQKQWIETGIVRFKLDTRWLGESIENTSKEAWQLHSLKISEDLHLHDALPPRMQASFDLLKDKIQQITSHKEYGFSKKFIARRWREEQILQLRAEEIFGNADLAYPWHKDPRYASAIITIKGRIGTEYVDFSENTKFGLYDPGNPMPLVYEIKPGEIVDVQQTGLHEVVILAGRHADNKGRSIIHRSPPSADPQLGAGGRIILLLELI